VVCHIHLVERTEGGGRGRDNWDICPPLRAQTGQSPLFLNLLLKIKVNLKAIHSLKMGKFNKKGILVQNMHTNKCRYIEWSNKCLKANY